METAQRQQFREYAILTIPGLKPYDYRFQRTRDCLCELINQAPGIENGHEE